MTRKVGWVAASFAVLVASGCDFSIEKLGRGDGCRSDLECVSGLSCVNRLCLSHPRAGTPVVSDANLHADIQVPMLKPPTAIADAGPDASADGG